MLIQVSKYFTPSLCNDKDWISTRSACHKSSIPLVNICLRLRRCLIGLWRVYASCLITRYFTFPSRYLSAMGKPRNYPVVQGYNIDQSFFQSIHGSLNGDLSEVVDLRFHWLNSREISVFPTRPRGVQFYEVVRWETFFQWDWLCVWFSLLYRLRGLRC